MIECMIVDKLRVDSYPIVVKYYELDIAYCSSFFFRSSFISLINTRDDAIDQIFLISRQYIYNKISYE